MEFATFEEIVDRAYASRVPHIHLCGFGEPLLNKRFWEYADRVIERYGDVSLQTNLHPKLLERHYDEIIARQASISAITTDALSYHSEVFDRIKVGASHESVLYAMESISKDTKGKILFVLSYIVTRQNYRDIDKLVLLYRDRGIRCVVSFSNLYTYDEQYSNEFLNDQNIYTSTDTEITAELERARKVLALEGIRVRFPQPRDLENQDHCHRLWRALQVGLPVEDADSEHPYGNAIVGGCEAVFDGEFHSMGNVFEHGSIRELWNNRNLVAIRQAMLSGHPPFPECGKCLGTAEPPESSSSSGEDRAW
jgi:MoaA/NifB/PqqE/SkfB family radical SAM enzyme